MKNGEFELCDVEPCMKRFKESGGRDWRYLLQARAALTDACEERMAAAAKESRGMDPVEIQSFDSWMFQVKSINRSLAKIRAARVAEHGEDMVVLPF